MYSVEEKIKYNDAFLVHQNLKKQYLDKCDYVCCYFSEIRNTFHPKNMFYCLKNINFNEL